MEMGEEKRKYIHRTTEFSYYNSIPLDVTREILLRLPAKSLVRFRCVSKLWSSITTQPDFIKSFVTHSSARPSLLLSFKREEKRLFFSLPQHENTDDKRSSHDDVSNNDINLPQNDGYMSNFESVHGLISFHHCLDHIVVWNPSIRQHVTLPKPENSIHGASYLGYDPIGDTYKLLCMPHIKDYGIHRPDYGPHVSTLGVEESWRVTKESPMYGSSASWKCINGVIYYEVYVPNGGSNNVGTSHMKRIIMSFNVRLEMFKSIELPCCMDNTQTGKHSLLSYEGRLALVCSSDTKLWILENADKWLCNVLHLPSPQMDSIGDINYLESDVSVIGEFIYVAESWNDYKEIHILFYDLKKNSIIRKIKFEGIRYEELKIHIGLGGGWNTIGCLPHHIGIVFREFWKFTRCSPNHIESLVSLKNITCSKLASLS